MERGAFFKIKITNIFLKCCLKPAGTKRPNFERASGHSWHDATNTARCCTVCLLSVEQQARCHFFYIYDDETETKP
jgi:hypothetical protein